MILCIFSTIPSETLLIYSLIPSDTHPPHVFPHLLWHPSPYVFPHSYARSTEKFGSWRKNSGANHLFL
jgi:hypothetical protein